MCNKMSDVRLSNASPTLERVDARQADNFRPSVRRNLFGTPDPAEIRRYVTATLQEEVRGFQETYNFDPVEERPLGPGDYEWEADSDPPEFYLRAPHGSRGGGGDALRGDTRRDAAEETERQPERNGSRKRRSEGSGSCASDCQSKILHTDEDDDEDESDGAGSVRRPSRPESSAEAH